MGSAATTLRRAVRKTIVIMLLLPLPIVTITIYEKAMNNLCSEQKIIYADKRVNNFLNNAEHKIILCKMLEIVYAENSEQFS